jgi:two-component system nitrogen regulation sensor histidine kinase NtrY
MPAVSASVLEGKADIADLRRFMEAVLSGATAGVVGLGADGTITLVNRSAEESSNVR